MLADIVKQVSPEEEELNKKREELSQLETELADKELQLATEQAELKEFEKLYYRAVGNRYATLDDLEARIAERVAQRNPANEEAQRQATDARQRAEESERESDYAQQLESGPAFAATDELRRLFRQIAKLFHPDLATDERDRTRRHELMVKANQAYRDGDEAALRRLLADWKDSPESVEGNGTGAQLVRVIRKIAQVRRRLAEIRKELRRVKESELSQLKAKVKEARESGRDLLAEMAGQLDQRIQEAKTQLSSLGRV